jgi:hypothetical protein
MGAAPWGGTPRANLNAAVTVRDSTGAVVLSGTGVGIAQTSFMLPAADTFSIMLASSGENDPLVDGYSAYGSRGAYMMVATFPADVVVPSVSAPRAD